MFINLNFVFQLYGRENIEKKIKSRENSRNELIVEKPKVLLTVGDDGEEDEKKDETDMKVEGEHKDITEEEESKEETGFEYNHVQGEPNKELKSPMNGVVGGANVISREDLILSPIPELNYVGNNNLEAEVS